MSHSTFGDQVPQRTTFSPQKYSATQNKKCINKNLHNYFFVTLNVCFDVQVNCIAEAMTKCYHFRKCLSLSNPHLSNRYFRSFSIKIWDAGAAWHRINILPPPPSSTTKRSFFLQNACAVKFLRKILHSSLFGNTFYFVVIM